VRITNYGGAHRLAGDEGRDGRMGDVVLGYNSVEGYCRGGIEDLRWRVVGRYGNRIAAASSPSVGTHTNSGQQRRQCAARGPHGFDDQDWTAQGNCPMAWR